MQTNISSGGGRQLSTVQDVAIEGAKAAPPVTVTGAWLSGIELSDLVLYLTALYTVLQIIFLLRDRWWREKGKPRGKGRTP